MSSVCHQQPVWVYTAMAITTLTGLLQSP